MDDGRSGRASASLPARPTSLLPEAGRDPAAPWRHLSGKPASFAAAAALLVVAAACEPLDPPRRDVVREPVVSAPESGADLLAAEPGTVSEAPAAAEAPDGSGRTGAPESTEDGGTSPGEVLPVVPTGEPERPGLDMHETGPLIHPRPGPPDDFEDARFPRPEHVRGLYVNAWAAGSSRRMGEIIEVARQTEVNALVIDIKDATGYLSHSTGVPLAHEIGATEERRIADLPGLLDRLEAEGLYPIARIVVVKDPILSTRRPELAVQDTAGGVWIDSKQIQWLNLYSEEVWAYHVAIAREVAEMGFPEIQWDYIRFPDAPESDLARAVWEGQDGRTRTDAVRSFLRHAREALSDLPVRSTADVFGVTTSFSRDVGIGQLWETFIDVVDVALPMVYPSHYWEGSFGFEEPNAYPYEVVRAALRDALRRSARVDGAGATRPWLQDFSLGQPPYGGAEVRAQIQATYDVGIEEWILWNPSSRYTESALEPVGGFEREPLVRVAGVLTPVSRRYVVMDSVAALPPEPVPDSAEVGYPLADDSASSDGAPPDTAATPAPVDTLAANWSS